MLIGSSTVPSIMDQGPNNVQGEESFIRTSSVDGDGWNAASIDSTTQRKIGHLSSKSCAQQGLRVKKNLLKQKNCPHLSRIAPNQNTHTKKWKKNYKSSKNPMGDSISSTAIISYWSLALKLLVIQLPFLSFRSRLLSDLVKPPQDQALQVPSPHWPPQSQAPSP